VTGEDVKEGDLVITGAAVAGAATAPATNRGGGPRMF